MKRTIHPSISFAAVMALLFVNASHAADLRPETVSAWEQYIQEKDAAVKLSAEAPWVTNDNRHDCAILRSGKILVAPAGPNIPYRVPGGLIHDWIGTAFIPNATISQVLAAVRDYDRYKDLYRPGVVNSKLVSSSDDQDRFSLLLMNKAIIMRKAIEGDYRASYFRINDHRWYSVAGSTRVQEVEDYGGPNERLLPVDQGAGLIWRVHTITRYEEREEGVFTQMEAMVLSRDVPNALRWIVNPIVRRVSRDSLQLSLQQTRGAVQSNPARLEAFVPVEKSLVTNEKQSVRLEMFK
jgi:hypothetical protein